LPSTNGGSSVSTNIKKEFAVGLDMYAYVAAKSGQQKEFYEKGVFDSESKDFVNDTVTKPREIAYWRKHPNLHGWMEKLWICKLAAEGKTPQKNSEWGSTFNGVELELTYEDLDELERAVKYCQLPETSGFFFGENSDEYYRERDLEFVRKARAELFCGLKVFYNSSW
jgi:hypothetical protein